ncbi:MAG: MaoC family dehydratase N-terminal domain-containing protein, partial [Myxococcota bacterium]
MAISGRQREEFEKELEAYVGLDIGVEDVGRNPVNSAMIRLWCEAMGDECGAYVDAEAAAQSIHAGLVAPPTML